jgi:DNA replication and repair protein RecF
MQFDYLKVNYVRNISNIYLDPAAGLNLIVGPNASGKTSLLEAIHLLARARSFRTPRIKEVIQWQQETLQVIARVSREGMASVSTGIEKSYGSTVIRYKGEPLKTVSEQANNIPLVIITPDTHLLVTGAPKDRRRWLDWAMFHVEPLYIKVWRNYHKALRNRNRLLKYGGNEKELVGWENIMSAAANSLDEFRQRFIKELQKQLSRATEGAFLTTPTLSFNKGCPDETSFEEYLKTDRGKDRQLGFTKHGPHKADVHFWDGDSLLSQTYSRGQVKRFVTALLVAQANTHESISGDKPVFLIDDYTAELDSHGRKELLRLMCVYGGQIFLTSTEIDEDLDNVTLFHVERGNFNKVVK